MANKKSAARQALKDMKEMGLDVSFIEGRINRLHSFNARISIITKEKTRKVVKVTKTTINITVNTAPKSYHYNSFRVNPDGTVGIFRDWDFD